MRKQVVLVLIAVAAFGFACLIVLNVVAGTKVSSARSELQRCRAEMLELAERAQKAESERDSANQTVAQLQRDLASLASQQKEDRMVIQDLWNTLMHNAGAVKEVKPDIKEEQTVRDAQEPTVEPATREKAIKYDGTAVKEMMSSGGGLAQAIGRIITSEGINSMLQERSEDPAYWVAAATVVQDEAAALAYLEAAVRLHPDSAIALSSLVNAHIRQGNTDESVQAYIEELQTVDPTNALADCYAAYCQFKSGDAQSALQSLSQASTKDRFADDRMDLLMARYDYFLNEGCSDSVAIGLSAFDLPLSHLGTIREVAQSAMEQASQFVAAGQYEDALQIAQDISNIGRGLSSSGRFIVYDRVGMALQRSALEQQKHIYESQADDLRAQEIDAQLQAVQQRSSTIDVMVEAFGGVLQNMTDADVADYVDATILNGEFSTLKSIPEIADALQRAQEALSDKLSEADTP